MPDPTLGAFELTVLLAVVRLGDDAYGLAVRRDVSARTGRNHSVGAVYTTLQRLGEKQFVASRASDPLPTRGGRSRRLFRVTAAGRRAIHRAERETAAIWSGVGRRIIPEGT